MLIATTILAPFPSNAAVALFLSICCSAPLFLRPGFLLPVCLLELCRCCCLSCSPLPTCCFLLGNSSRFPRGPGATTTVFRMLSVRLWRQGHGFCKFLSGEETVYRSMRDLGLSTARPSNPAALLARARSCSRSTARRALPFAFVCIALGGAALSSLANALQVCRHRIDSLGLGHVSVPARVGLRASPQPGPRLRVAALRSTGVRWSKVGFDRLWPHRRRVALVKN